METFRAKQNTKQDSQGLKETHFLLLEICSSLQLHLVWPVLIMGVGSIMLLYSCLGVQFSLDCLVPSSVQQRRKRQLETAPDCRLVGSSPSLGGLCHSHRHIDGFIWSEWPRSFL